MGLDRALKTSMDARELETREVIGKMQQRHSKATAYRLLAGATNDPRLSTFVELCKAVESSPTELLEMAGLWEFRERSADPLDMRLRKVFSEVQQLPASQKRVAVEQIHSIVRAWKAVERDLQGRRS